ncbi:germination protein YpeB [Paenibacillus sp. CAA11]|uniref:germination protein YpeB n=1 Tax=Paenibacillus sp. CAA11 TaxID=1532905 RepID=UPI000D38A8DB|nr:germination protein YpeB [Paenibacillus sp. CAA11]AWB45034.1 germination protein YpeB [Paenibacillus sp. CAA11]
MYTRISGVLFPVAVVLLVGALIWGYQESQTRNSIQIKAENQYQRAFHDLSYHVDRLHGELGNTLAVHSNSSGVHRKGLMNVWRITSEAQSEINQLPLTLLPFNQTEEFLSRISKFSYQTAARDLTKQPLTEKEKNNLKELYKSSEQISKGLQQVQDKVITNRLRWMEVDNALATEAEPKDNTIIDGFKTVDKQVSQYPELDYGPSVLSVYHKRSVKQLGEKPATVKEIQSKAARFLSLPNPSILQVNENGTGTDWASYTAVYKGQGKKGQPAVTLDFTRNGGDLISFHNSREVGPRKVSAAEARQKAEKFLESKGFSNMKAVTYDEYDNIGSLTYVRSDKGTLIYPEKLSLRMALDNGEVTGMQCSDYVYEQHTSKTTPKPNMSLAEARKHLNPDFKESYHRTVVIDNDASQRIAAYEFGGRINGSVYKIFLNGDTGEEEKIEEVRQSGRLAQG